MTSKNHNPFNIQGTHHPAFATPDIKKTIRFWCDLLGFKLVLSYDMGTTSQFFFALSNQFMISFFEWKNVKNPPYKRHGQEVTGTFGFDHLAFGLSSQNDLFGLQDELVEANIPVTDVIDHGFIYSIYTFDPNRIALEFNCPVRNSDLYSHPVLKRIPISKSDDESPNLRRAENRPPVDDLDRLIIDGEGKEYFI